MVHQCITKINNQLKAKNTRITQMMMFGVDMSQQSDPMVVMTEKIDLTVRGKPVVVFANYCPFCGIHLLP
jgi:hypothetical protein